MIVACEVLEELTESFVGKRGPRSIPLWVCLDRTPDGVGPQSRRTAKDPCWIGICLDARFKTRCLSP